jgi:hypothetical protein
VIYFTCPKFHLSLLYTLFRLFKLNGFAAKRFKFIILMAVNNRCLEAPEIVTDEGFNGSVDIIQLGTQQSVLATAVREVYLAFRRAFREWVCDLITLIRSVK